eukprot:360299-Chlamydomonas_euryale.AAC.5
MTYPQPHQRKRDPCPWPGYTPRGEGGSRAVAAVPRLAIRSPLPRLRGPAKAAPAAHVATHSAPERATPPPRPATASPPAGAEDSARWPRVSARVQARSCRNPSQGTGCVDDAAPTPPPT